MKSITKEIDNVVITVLVSRGRREINYYLPQGFTGVEFLSFKNKHQSLITHLKETCYGKEKKELKFKEVDSVSFKPISSEGLSDNLDLRQSTDTG